MKKLAPYLLSIRRIALLWIVALYPCLAHSESSSIYYYNPETNIDNFVTLKDEMDGYLGHLGASKFQPFSKAEPFESALRKKVDGVLLISSWHYQKLRKEFLLQPALVAMTGGTATHRKVLSVKGERTILALKGKHLASSSSRAYTYAILKNMLGDANKDVIDSIKIMTVPKDMDALLSLAFGVSQAALTTEKSLANLQKINPFQFKKMQIRAHSQEVLLPIVATFSGQSKKYQEMVEILQKMGADTNGIKTLRMFGLERFRALTKPEIKMLEQ